MVDTAQKWDLYKAPKDKILENRKAFYGLQRKCNEPTDKWLKRVQNCISRCEFPIFVEFLLIDRFVCALNKTEIGIIRGTDTWSLKKLLECFLDHTGSTNKNDKPDSNVSARILDSESVSTRL